MHSWDLTPKEAIQLQNSLRDRIRTDLSLDQPRRVAGVDVSYLPREGVSIASVVVFPPDCGETTEWAISRMKTPFPYVPGLLSFRELPSILQAIRKLKHKPDVIFVDGHGQAHPRRFGIACHLGLWLKIPTIGIGKSLLCGSYRVPAQPRGSHCRLLHKGELVGQVLRTRQKVKPIFVSVGYGLPLEECLHWTLKLTPRFRLPEPIRRADRLSREQKSTGSKED